MVRTLLMLSLLIAPTIALADNYRSADDSKGKPPRVSAHAGKGHAYGRPQAEAPFGRGRPPWAPPAHSKGKPKPKPVPEIDGGQALLSVMLLAGLLVTSRITRRR